MGAIEGRGRWLAPRHIYRLRQSVVEATDPADRLAYYRRVPRASEEAAYADNSREGARDEAIRRGLIPLNAMVLRTDVSVTSMEGRYALTEDFTRLFDPALKDAAFDAAARAWQGKYLSGAALARAAVLQGIDAGGVEIALPQGGAVVLPAGESPVMTKHVVEQFAKRFLVNPVVVWISDSREKVYQHDTLVKAMQVQMDAARLLPDVVLVDLAPPGRQGRLLVVFVEVVFSDGPVDEGRREQLWKLLEASPKGYKPEDAAYVTVYTDRTSSRPAARAPRELAWNSFAWFVTEPDCIVQYRGGPPVMLASLL